MQDVTEETLHDGPDDTMQCEDGLIWCETTMQCIDPTTVSCSTIKVVKGTHHMDAIVQGEKSAIIFHDSEAEGQHELKMKLEEERLKYEANKAQNSLQNQKDEEQMKKDLTSRKVKEEAEKKRYKEETNTLNKLQHKCVNAREALTTAKNKLITSNTKLIQATDRLDDTNSALRTKSAACEAYSNQTAVIQASGSKHINKERSSTVSILSEWSEHCEWSTVVDILIPPPCFKPVSLYLSRSPLSKTPKQVFFNPYFHPINIFVTFARSFTVL